MYREKVTDSGLMEFNSCKEGLMRSRQWLMQMDDDQGVELLRGGSMLLCLALSCTQSCKYVFFKPICGS